MITGMVYMMRNEKFFLEENRVTVVYNGITCGARFDTNTVVQGLVLYLTHARWEPSGFQQS